MIKLFGLHLTSDAEMACASKVSDAYMDYVEMELKAQSQQLPKMPPPPFPAPASAPLHDESEIMCPPKS